MERWKQIMLAGVAAMGIWVIGGVRAEAAVPINEATFPDSAVRAHVKVYDKNNDGVLSDEELKIPTQLNSTTQRQAEEYFLTKPGTIVDFKGMENFPNIKELHFQRIGYDQGNPLSLGYYKGNWNYGGSDLLQCFPYAEKISLSGNDFEQEVVGQITLSGTSDCLKEVRICDDEYPCNLKVMWNVKAKNLKHVEIRVHELDGMINSGGELSSLESLILECDKMQHCNLAFAKMSLLKYLSLCGYDELSQKDWRDNGVFPEELSKTKLETLYYNADTQDYGFLSGLKYLKSLTISGYPSDKNVNLSNRNFSLKGLSSLEKLSLITARYSELDLNPVKKTLKVLYVGPEYSLNYEGIYGVTTNIALKRLDISQMERLEELYGCHTGIEKLITRDASGKSALKKLRKVLLWNTKAKSIRLEDMPALEELELSGDYSRLNFTKCKKLHTIRLKSNKLKALDLRKNTMLKSLDIRGAKKVKKLNLSKNKILKSAMIQNMPISELNLSKNTFLYGLNFNATSKIKMKRLTLPSLREPKINMTNHRKKYRVDVLDLSRLKKMTTKTRGKYLHAFQFKNGYKKVIISKKLKKSHRNWFKKKAKKVKAKVIVR